MSQKMTAPPVDRISTSDDSAEAPPPYSVESAEPSPIIATPIAPAPLAVAPSPVSPAGHHSGSEPVHQGPKPVFPFLASIPLPSPSQKAPKDKVTNFRDGIAEGGKGAWAEIREGLKRPANGIAESVKQGSVLGVVGGLVEGTIGLVGATVRASVVLGNHTSRGVIRGMRSPGDHTTPLPEASGSSPSPDFAPEHKPTTGPTAGASSSAQAGFGSGIPNLNANGYPADEKREGAPAYTPAANSGGGDSSRREAAEEEERLSPIEMDTKIEVGVGLRGGGGQGIDWWQVGIRAWVWGWQVSGPTQPGTAPPRASQWRDVSDRFLGRSSLHHSTRIYSSSLNLNFFFHSSSSSHSSPSYNPNTPKMPPSSNPNPSAAHQGLAILGGFNANMTIVYPEDSDDEALPIAYPSPGAFASATRALRYPDGRVLHGAHIPGMPPSPAPPHATVGDHGAPTPSAAATASTTAAAPTAARSTAPDKPLPVLRLTRPSTSTVNTLSPQVQVPVIDCADADTTVPEALPAPDLDNNAIGLFVEASGNRELDVPQIPCTAPVPVEVEPTPAPPRRSLRDLLTPILQPLGPIPITGLGPFRNLNRSLVPNIPEATIEGVKEAVRQLREGLKAPVVQTMEMMESQGILGAPMGLVAGTCNLVLSPVRAVCTLSNHIIRGAGNSLFKPTPAAAPATTLSPGPGYIPLDSDSDHSSTPTNTEQLNTPITPRPPLQQESETSTAAAEDQPHYNDAGPSYPLSESPPKMSRLERFQRAEARRAAGMTLPGGSDWTFSSAGSNWSSADEDQWQRESQERQRLTSREPDQMSGRAGESGEGGRGQGRAEQV
ncbi:uncharacterized protein MKK02DRAFT_28019 [Dioszegia hungarica]|uniref:Uncharacterized protein n=1 Tax=Dioszegia hungarica TaxID=4972 RepID=A0AA38H6N3_9TREE|nr:uncharacterized protein MKK02DRAFT_28019 [Dioszegia hungarica]KAI9634893.1 hypothetical protein MKK02DRAFT_28019 [Dioszegia hungarica]